MNIARFYKRERMQLACEVTTPMFLGNADQEAELRAAPFKGMLRYWWRVAEGRKYGRFQDLLAAESRIFGSADEKTGGKSLVSIRVEPVSGMTASKEKFPFPGNIQHRECEKTGGKVNPLNYLAGMGLIHFRNGIQHSYFPARARFRVTIDSTGDVAGEVDRAVTLFTHFAAIGSRSRNGWGCFEVERKKEVNFGQEEWRKAMDRDYPNCLGRDNSGPLYWSTRETYGSWHECMRELAAIYIKVRTNLDVIHGNPPDRHLLGYPVTNHPVRSWGRSGRHGSALRLLVRKDGAGYRGAILHLPHLFSDTMWHGEEERQVRIWKSVHQKLDALCRRASYEEI